MYIKIFGLMKTNSTSAISQKTHHFFKDEVASIPVVEFGGLRSKMYSYIKNDGKGGKTAKGIEKNVIKKQYQA